MHVQATRSLGYIPITKLIDALNVFPADTIRTHRVLGRWRQFCPGRQKCVCDIGRIGRLAQIVGRPDLDRCNRRRNGAIAGQNNNPAIGALLTQHFDNIQAVAILKPQVTYGKGRWSGRCYRFAGGNRSCHLNVKTALFHRFGKSFQKSIIVINQKKRPVLSDVVKVFGHATIPRSVTRS